MIFWIDAQLSPALAPWLGTTFEFSALALRDLGMRDATDREIFLAAREEGAILITKDADFLRLLETLGPPPQVVWVTCGNTSNANLRTILAKTLPRAIELLKHDKALVEISGILMDE
jgi:predicted nuclease of predicted toxin-antitoxin system